MLFDSETQPPPVFTYHEFSLTDAVGHDYGPHHDAVRDAVADLGVGLRKLAPRGRTLEDVYLGAGV